LFKEHWQITTDVAFKCLNVVYYFLTCTLNKYFNDVKNSVMSFFSREPLPLLTADFTYSIYFKYIFLHSKHLKGDRYWYYLSLFKSLPRESLKSCHVKVQNLVTVKIINSKSLHILYFKTKRSAAREDDPPTARYTVRFEIRYFLLIISI